MQPTPNQSTHHTNTSSGPSEVSQGRKWVHWHNKRQRFTAKYKMNENAMSDGMWSWICSRVKFICRTASHPTSQSTVQDQEDEEHGGVRKWPVPRLWSRSVRVLHDGWLMASCVARVWVLTRCGLQVVQLHGDPGDVGTCGHLLPHAPPAASHGHDLRRRRGPVARSRGSVCVLELVADMIVIIFPYGSHTFRCFDVSLLSSVVCGPPGLPVSALLASNLTWVASDLLTSEICRPNRSLLNW